MTDFVKKVNELSRKRSLERFKIMEIRKEMEYWYSKVPQEIKDKGLIELNTIIAKFMGYGVDDSNKFFYGIHYYTMNADSSDKTYDQLTIENVRSHTEGFVYTYSDLIERRYDNHWDMLMPVVEKIESLPVTFTEYTSSWSVVISDNDCYIEYNGHESGTIARVERASSKLEATFKAVVEFIKWYNEQEKK